MDIRDFIIENVLIHENIKYFMNPYNYLHTFNYKSEMFTFEIKLGIEITKFLYQDLYNVFQKARDDLSLSL